MPCDAVAAVITGNVGDPNHLTILFITRDIEDRARTELCKLLEKPIKGYSSFALVHSWT